MNEFEYKIYQNRLNVSELINAVLINKISVSDALNKFPTDKNDINIKCAFNALVHYEADEDLRKKDVNYKDLQDEYLYTISQILKQNKQLPANIIGLYNQYYVDDIIYKKPKSFLDDILESLKRKLFF